MTQLGKVKGTFNKKQTGQTLTKINNKMMRKFNPLLLIISKCTNKTGYDRIVVPLE